MGIINAGPQLPASTAQRESAPEDSTFIRTLTAAQADAPLFRFIDFLRPHLALIAGASVMGILRFTIPLTIPLVFKYLIDMLLTPHSHVERVNLLIDRWCIAVASLMRLGTDTSGKLVAITVVLGALFAVQAVCCYFRNYWASKAGHRLIFDLRFGLFRHMQGLSHSFFDKHSSGSILSRFITDIHTAHEFVSFALTDIWTDAVSLVFVLWILFELNLQLALISLCVLPLYVAIIRVFSPKIKRASHCFHEQFADFSGHLQERIAGASTVRSFGRGDYEANLFQHRTESIYHLTLDNVKLASSQQFLIELITRFAPLVIICAGTRLVWSGKMPLGTMVAFYAYVGLLYQPLQRFSETSMLISSSLAAIERILQFFSERSEITQHPNSVPLVLQNGSVDFESVSFGYKNRDGDDYRLVLDNINLHVEPGTTVALVGRSGAGKTTLASLITRFYDVTAGRITIDGVDIRNVSLLSLSENIGIVIQDSVLFSVTVRENLLYGNPAADERALWRALDDANIKTFVESLPHRLDTIIGERGIKLSGGQSQRIALARIFLKNPAILILDEATSALDSESENLVHDAMRRLMHGRTSFLIAHRLSIASEADLIVVLDQGRIAEVGLHDDLLRNRGIYWKLVSEQTRRLSNLIAFPATAPREEAETRVA